ncbi:hypothetical protein JOC70_002804 [Clostridium pascui]|uniref:DUF4363 family protein n=1 Tax=Clostridium pascui TaxID=46609 RepID=UPI00195E95E9|nr:DUF4363 family protein [Clostridium pascui]MBM7871306.1 hypothetical protein [Clostridium pascui]
MRKFFIVSIPIVTIICFILIMLSGNYLKNSFSQNDNVPQLIQVLNKNISDEKWEEANSTIERLDQAWNKIVRRVQFSLERDEINGFSFTLARLRGAIKGKDKVSSFSELSEVYERWNSLGK